MVSFRDFVESDRLEETIVSNCPDLRRKFNNIIEKAGVGELDIQDKNALAKIRTTISWSWAPAIFSSYWAIYRKEKLLGWGTFSLAFVFAYLSFYSETISKISNIYPWTLIVLVGMYGNSYLLYNAVKTYSDTTSPTDRQQRSIFQLFVAMVLALLFLIMAFFEESYVDSEIETNTYNEFYDEFLGCKLTKECINNILMNYITHAPNGIFIIYMYGEKGNENVYVQGRRSADNSFDFEAVSQVYSDEVTPEVINSLVKLGWNLPYDSNFTQTVYYDQILNNEAANLLYQTLESYNLETAVITKIVIDQ